MPLSDGQHEILGRYWSTPSTAANTYHTSTLTRGRKRTMTIPWGTVSEWAIFAVLLVYVWHVW